MHRIIECVPNFSTSDPNVIKIITSAIKKVADIRLLNVEPDIDYNRVVVTLVGTPESVGEAVFQGIAKATELIDMSKHKGEHPRLGALDVCPFIPVKNVTDEDCISIARNLANRIAEELKVPTYLYGKAATKENRVKLSDIRKGQYEGLSEKIKQPEWKPDYGNTEFNAKSGAYVIGARDFLIAYNVNIESEDVSIAKEVAEIVRESGRLVEKDGEKVRVPGKLKGIQGMGFPLERDGRKLTQVSMNVVDFRNKAKLHEAFEEVKKLVEEKGVKVTGSEVVGLIPLEAVLEAGRFYSPEEQDQDKLIDIAIEKLGFSDLEEFNPKRKIIELMIDAELLVDLSVSDFIDDLASNKPTPGGGSVAALGGSLAAALITMVANLSTGKEKFATVENEMKNVASKAVNLQEYLKNGVDEDTDAFNQVMKAFRMSKEDPDARSLAIQKALTKATEVPLKTAKRSFEIFDIAQIVVEKGNKNAISDAGVAVLFAEAAVRGALFNVQINLMSIKDETVKSTLSQIARKMLDEVSIKRDTILKIIDKELSD